MRAYPFLRRWSAPMGLDSERSPAYYLGKATVDLSTVHLTGAKLAIPAFRARGRALAHRGGDRLS